MAERAAREGFSWWKATRRASPAKQSTSPPKVNIHPRIFENSVLIVPGGVFRFQNVFTIELKYMDISFREIHFGKTAVLTKKGKHLTGNKMGWGMGR